jgi:hypothetical protein
MPAAFAWWAAVPPASQLQVATTWWPIVINSSTTQPDRTPGFFACTNAALAAKQKLK